MAESLQLNGTVRNATDGTVEVRVAGPPDALDRFERKLGEGPRGARVDEVRPTPPAEEPLPVGFRIVH